MHSFRFLIMVPLNVPSFTDKGGVKGERTATVSKYESFFCAQIKGVNGETNYEPEGKPSTWLSSLLQIKGVNGKTKPRQSLDLNPLIILCSQIKGMNGETNYEPEGANVIRWRQDAATGARQSNAKLVRWSDGSMTLHVGAVSIYMYNYI